MLSAIGLLLPLHKRLKSIKMLKVIHQQRVSITEREMFVAIKTVNRDIAILNFSITIYLIRKIITQTFHIITVHHTV